MNSVILTIAAVLLSFISYCQKADSVLFDSIHGIYYSSYSNQDNCYDTFRVYLASYGDYRYIKKNSNYYICYKNNKAYFFKNKRTFRKCTKNYTEKYLFDTNFICAGYTLTIFYTKNKKIIAEGYWGPEAFWGPYKEYYKNGKIKLTGYYHSSWKENIWKYYSENGKLIKIERYLHGRLVSTN